MTAETPRPDWVLALHHFLTALVYSPPAEVDLIAEFTMAALARRRSTPDRAKLDVEPLPVRGRLAVLACLNPDSAVSAPDKLTPRQLVQISGGAVRVIRDIMDRYGLTPEDQHDLALADLWLTNAVNELGRRYGIRRDANTAEVQLSNTRAGQGAVVPATRKGP